MTLTHQTHTTVTGPSTITTAGGQLKIEDFTTVEIHALDTLTGKDGGTGTFIVRQHGFDYEDFDPLAVWVQLMPVTSENSAEVWAQRRIEVAEPSPDHPYPLKHRTPAPAGWVNKPGAAELDLDQARAAMAIARELAVHGAITRAEFLNNPSVQRLLNELTPAPTEGHDD